MTDSNTTATQPPIRVDVAGVPIYVRSEFEVRHLTRVNHQLAIAKLALHKINDGQLTPERIAGSAIEDMKNDR